MNLPLAFLIGILSFLDPCVIAMVPIYLGYLAVQRHETVPAVQREFATVAAVPDSIAHMTESATPLSETARVPVAQVALTRWALARRTLLFVAGFSTIFLTVGALVVFIGDSVGGVVPWMFRVGAVLTILLGVALLGGLRFTMGAERLTGRLRRISAVNSPHGAYALGLALAVAWIPCIGRIMVLVAALAGTTQRFSDGFGMLAAYCLGLAIPFLAIAVFGKAPLAKLRKSRRFLSGVTIFAGLALIVVGSLILSGTWETVEHSIQLAYQHVIPILFGWFHHLHNEGWWKHLS